MLATTALKEGKWISLNLSVCKQPFPSTPTQGASCIPNRSRDRVGQALAVVSLGVTVEKQCTEIEYILYIFSVSIYNISM